MQMSQINPPDDWLKTGWARVSQTRTRLVVSLFCITCSLKNNAFSVLYYVIKVTLHYQGAYSLRSKRFRLVLEQKRPWKGIFGFDRARNETRTKKWKRGEGRGRKDKVRKNGQQTCNLSCNIAAEQVEKRCGAFYNPRSNLLITWFVARQVWCGW